MAAASSSSATAYVNDPEVEAIVEKLLEVRGSRPGKQVNLSETEIRNLCTKAREIFMNQPVLLELEAPIKICGAAPAGLGARSRAAAALPTRAPALSLSLSHRARALSARVSLRRRPARAVL